MDYKQNELMKIIRERISTGKYTDFLPRAADLAQEFQVNIKTMNKALLQLANQGLIRRKRHSGTQILSSTENVPREHVIEVLFEGFASIFTHPFWAGIWEPMVQKLSFAGFRTVLTMYESDPETGLTRLDGLTFYPAIGRIIFGSGEKMLLDRAAETRVPFITACDPLDPAVPQISFDFTEGIRDAVDWLYARGCRQIGFIGQTQSFINPQQLNKYNAYLKAVQKFYPVDPALIGNTRPVLGGGEKALSKLLKITQPDALIAAYDNQMPEILRLLEKHGLAIPVIGCDGLQLPGVPSERPVVKAPLHKCGELVAEKIIHAVHVHRKPGSVVLKAQFVENAVRVQP